MNTTLGFIRRMGLALAAMGCMFTQGQALAQAYPTKPIKFVVPFSAGSATDIVARTVADAMGKSMGQTIVIDNRLGAGGTIAAALVAKSDADGIPSWCTPRAMRSMRRSTPIWLTTR